MHNKVPAKPAYCQSQMVIPYYSRINPIFRDQTIKQEAQR